jgi:hypothetical protein
MKPSRQFASSSGSRKANAVETVRQRSPDRECFSVSGQRNPLVDACIRVQQEEIAGRRLSFSWSTHEPMWR